MIPLYWLLACTCTQPDDTAPQEPWALVGDQLGDVVLLSGWSTDSELLIVGGDLGQSAAHGDLLRLSEQGICVHEALTEQPLWWIHGLSAEDWWAVGGQGTALHWDGTDFVRQDVPTTATLYGVYVGPDSVWAVGGVVQEERGEVWRHDGTEWVAVDTELQGMAFKVWQDWIVGVGQSWRVEGESLTPIETSERLITVTGRASDDVYAVGGQAGPVVLHSDGGPWTELEIARLNGPLNGAWTGPGETLWVAGAYGVMAQLGESGWEIPAMPLTSEHFHAVTQHDGAMWWLGGNYFDAGNNYGTIGCHGCDLSVSELPACGS